MAKLAIKVKNLTKKFGEFIAVNNASFQVEKGEIFAFLGPNGAGKSTTIKMLTTLLLPTAGEILVNGFNPATQQTQVRKSLGIVFQDPSLDEELTACENMDFHGILYKIKRGLKEDRIKELLDIVDLWDRRDDLVKTFSGWDEKKAGDYQRLAASPFKFFLDEPTIDLEGIFNRNNSSWLANRFVGIVDPDDNSFKVGGYLLSKIQI